MCKTPNSTPPIRPAEESLNQERSLLLDAVYQSVETLHAEIDRHHALMVGVLTENLDPVQVDTLVKGRQPPSVVKLKTTIADTIDVLEESRKAFKSKQLEMLRKKLMRVLFETEQAR